MVMSTGETITDAFLDWVKLTIAGTGLVADGCLFDEREKDLVWIVSSEVQAVGDLVAMISLPSISHDEKSAAAEGYKVSLTLTLRRCAVLNGTQSHAVAEKLFRVFSGAKFYPDADELESLIANVYADSLRHSTKGQSDALHTMTLTYYTELQPD